MPETSYAAGNLVFQKSVDGLGLFSEVERRSQAWLPDRQASARSRSERRSARIERACAAVWDSDQPVETAVVSIPTPIKTWIKLIASNMESGLISTGPMPLHCKQHNK
jgi:hypothetical protein